MIDSIQKESWKDKSFVLKKVKQYGFTLSYADKSSKKDKSIVLEAVKQHGVALKFADKSLQKDSDIIKATKRKVL